jgi:ABC-2 type transport system permease protein
MRLAWAFFKRDALTSVSYKFAFVAQVVGRLILLGLFYFLGKTLGMERVPAMQQYGGNFLAFVVVGIALSDCVTVGLTTFAQQIRDGQLTGTLELTLMSPVSLALILIYSSLWSYFLSACRFALYLALGALLFGVHVGNANLPAVLLVFVFTVIPFMGLGIMWSSVVLLIKRGEAVAPGIGDLAMLVSGAVFPTSVMPLWLRYVSKFVPLTQSLDAMRLALFQGRSVLQLQGNILSLTVFTVVCLFLGVSLFSFALDRTKRIGSLTEY